MGLIQNKKSQQIRLNPALSRVALAALLLPASGCVVDSGEGGNQKAESPFPAETSGPPQQESPEDQGAVASSLSTSTELGKNLQIDIYALEDVGNELIRLRIGATNNSTERYRLYGALGDVDNKYTASAVTLLDAENSNRHLSYKLEDGSCFCSSFDGALDAGEAVELWVIFPAPPDGVEAMTITTPVTPPFLDIPITKSTETVENQGISEAEITPLTMISDNLEDQTGRTESSDEVSIILSSDVLFETNSAELSQKAEEVLRQVATEIDDASSSIVDVDGYADNTGSDSINIPLSQERAKAVESVLSELVTRSGVAFEVKGHGSSNPIADNSTEEGRERNRRVSVTFEK